MCRLFGFRSVVRSQVHSSLVGADDSLLSLSNKHPDGWGVAYYVENAPHLIKSESTAINDHLFRRVSGVVSSETVIAHLRKATLGTINIANTHPFQYGKWVFAHNGNIRNYTKHRAKLLDLLDDDLARYILGDTDSELLFFILLTEMRRVFSLSESDVPSAALHKAVARAITKITDIVGAYELKDTDPSLTYLTFLLSNGQSFLAHHGGQPLWYSTFKSRCSERDTCSSFSEVCEAASKTGLVNHLIFSSEPITGENIWHEMSAGDFVLIGSDMMLQKKGS